MTFIVNNDTTDFMQFKHSRSYIRTINIVKKVFEVVLLNAYSILSKTSLDSLNNEGDSD